MIKHKILELHNQGKSYQEIADELNCSKSIICYHCSNGQKEKYAVRQKKYKANNPLIKKLDNFNQSYKKKGIDNKITHFQRKGEKSKLSIKLILEAFGTEPSCYLTGDKINISEPSTYSFDHKIPVAKGGDNSLNNLGLCTQEVNMAKSDKTPEEFIELCKKVLIHHGYTITK